MSADGRSMRYSGARIMPFATRCSGGPSARVRPHFVESKKVPATKLTAIRHAISTEVSNLLQDLSETSRGVGAASAAARSVVTLGAVPIRSAVTRVASLAIAIAFCVVGARVPDPPDLSDWSDYDRQRLRLRQRRLRPR